MEERVELLAPSSKREHALAQAMDAFSNFVLYDERESCLAILRLEKHSEEVGELQGGNDDYSIYRVVLTPNPKDAIAELLQKFHQSTSNCRQQHSAILLTKESLQQYMVDMCLRFSPLYKELYNVMLVFSFGATEGQVRHIDHTHPNAMVCLYMSRDCPTTIVYSSTSSHDNQHTSDTIANCDDLLDHWQEQQEQQGVPDLLKDILLQQEHTDLSHTYFSHWNTTLHHQLQNFGKLYLMASSSPEDDNDDLIAVFEPTIDPGTTLIASGNAIHAGPPTKGPRMFAYAIGVCDTSGMDDNYDAIDGDKQQINDGEVQYSPALLQLDLCCLVFHWMREECIERIDEHLEVKQFMVNILVEMVLDMQRKHGNETYARLLSDDRSQTRAWMGRVVLAGENHHDLGVGNDEEDIQSLIQQAVMECDTIFAIPHVATNASSAKRLQQDRRKKKKLRKGRRLKTN